MKIKNVYFMPRGKAENISPNTSEAMISISVPNDPAKLSSGWARDRLLRLQFHDADNEGNVNLLVGQKIDGIMGPKLFTKQDAKQIIDFVEKNKNKVDTIFVHCDAGISRSAAVAKFIAEIYKLKFPEGYAIYNKHVYRVLRNTFNNMMWSDNYES